MLHNPPGCSFHEELWIGISIFKKCVERKSDIRSFFSDLGIANRDDFGFEEGVHEL
jgi:hypothetical protein